ncbi:hypothetical protein Btru_068036 [Bulinus truncatus]|nr:hypothetical protein Btru_068036 [Bulinus truncatus]
MESYTRRRDSTVTYDPLREEDTLNPHQDDHLQQTNDEAEKKDLTVATDLISSDSQNGRINVGFVSEDQLSSNDRTILDTKIISDNKTISDDKTITMDKNLSDDPTISNGKTISDYIMSDDKTIKGVKTISDGKVISDAKYTNGNVTGTEERYGKVDIKFEQLAAENLKIDNARISGNPDRIRAPVKVSREVTWFPTPCGGPAVISQTKPRLQ